jgi:hypothetical protein
MSQITKKAQEDDRSLKNMQEVEERRKKIYRSMSAEQKLTIAAELYYAALGLKKAHLQRLNPDWPQAKVDDKAREWMLYART